MNENLLLDKERIDNVVRYKITTKDDMELLMQSRLEMLRAVNELPSDYIFDQEFVLLSRQYFERAN